MTLNPSQTLLRNVVLVGFMGSGKTTVGRALAALTGWALADTDDEIVQNANGATIPELFARHGEAAFRDREAHAVQTVCTRENQIIATGGGAILRPENVEALQNAGRVVWLTARPEVVVLRVQAARHERPILATGANTDGGETSLLTHVLTLLGQRGPLYQAAAHLIVDSSDKAPDVLARHIARKVGLI